MAFDLVNSLGYRAGSPQDVPHYLGEATMASVEGNATQVLVRQRCRQKAWLKRKQTDTVSASRLTLQVVSRSNTSGDHLAVVSSILRLGAASHE